MKDGNGAKDEERKRKKIKETAKETLLWWGKRRKHVPLTDAVPRFLTTQARVAVLPRTTVTFVGVSGSMKG